ncbi:MAG: RsmE family RNA methyltransferase [Spirochaetaceae bacterium]|jgi:RsmE family RNA methyltransferase|nr:RsmE family RNA methyltransferase [Spirochaetaceae bacterium]
MNLILFERHEITSDNRAVLPLRDERAVHLLKTLHKKHGDSFDAGVSGGNRGKGVILTIHDVLTIKLMLNAHPPPRLPIRLGVGFVRPIQLRRILREAANFGIETLDFFVTGLGDPNYMSTTLFDEAVPHCAAYSAMIEGAIEARDTCIPAVRRFPSLYGWLSALNETHAENERLHSQIRIALDNRDTVSSLFEVQPPIPESLPVSVVLAVGSERGWTDEERAELQRSGFERRILGQRALRTETACIAAIVVAMSWL